jgi:SAM-dependent methyltransferase
MRKIIKDFVNIIAKHIRVADPIYEFGSMQVPGQEEFADLRTLFSGKQYFGADMREGPGVDKILNLHDIGLPSGCVGTVLCLDTLEHVEYPHKALEEIYRILKRDGIVIISSVMNFQRYPCSEYNNLDTGLRRYDDAGRVY